jgi:Cu/Ag efflux protein CusF
MKLHFLSEHLHRGGPKRRQVGALQGAALWVTIALSSILIVSCAPQPPLPPPAPPTPSPSPTPAAVVKNPLDYPAPIIGKPYSAKGVVTIINLNEGWVEINHEEIGGLMPAMQMEWTVKPKSLMKSIHVGDKVEFTVVETGKGEIITSIKTTTP